LFNNNVHFDKVTFDNQVYFDDVKFGDNLEIRKEKSNYVTNFSDTNFKNGADFFNATFAKWANFPNAVFGGYTSFKETNFSEVANFLGVHFEGGTCFTSSSFKQNACFASVTFHGDANFDHVKFQIGEDCESESITDFSGAHFQKTAELSATFGHDVSFKEVIFDDNVEFGDAEFLQKAFFCGTQFKKDALFSNTIFQEVDFNQGKFYQNAYFYGATFRYFPNFLQAIFGGDVNFTNTELDFGFDDTRRKIEKTYNDMKKTYHAPKNKKSKEYPKKHKIANEFRDSFRNIKSSLIKNHNMLDASNYHRVELYCKELELEHKRKEELEKSTTRDFVDRIQLMFYRLTSDHHTDLLLILNNVIFLIAWFGIMNSTLNFLFNRDYFDLSIEKILMALGALAACFMFIIVMLCFVFGYFKIFFVAYARKRFYCKIRKLWKQFNLRQLYNKYNNKNGIFCIAYIITAIILVVKPALLVPIFGQMIDSKSSIGFAFASLNIIYAIFMFLLIFSLQKTARKNTIVPN
ncbi:MAG: pentapeptide repeat-containing protein, partial [Helicobacter sp.]|nr:pentapeptide repeat-containing protein [Helicobacter sp.]